MEEEGMTTTPSDWETAKKILYRKGQFSCPNKKTILLPVSYLAPILN